jgi:large subunit ribosomal protein L3
MGSEKNTVQNLKVVDVDRDNNTILVKGAVPGANGTYLLIKYALKKPIAPRKQEDVQETQGESKE